MNGISEDSKGNIWVATDNCGIVRLSGDFTRPSTLKKEYFNPQNANFVVNDAIYAFEDSQHRVWATSNSGGLFRLNSKTQSFDNMNDELHWDLDRVFSIKEDLQHRLWLTTDDALVCLLLDKKGKAHYTTFTSENGLGDMIFMPSSCFRLGNMLYFGAGRNIISVNSSMVNDDNKLALPNMIVTSIIIDGERYADLDSTMQQRLGDATPQYARKLTIPASVGKFAVEFALLSYINTDKCKYAYFLEGYDRDWHYVDADVRQASFENIPSGTYKLHLKASDSYGRWTELPYSISIHVLPPWYASPWAYLIYMYNHRWHICRNTVVPRPTAHEEPSADGCGVHEYHTRAAHSAHRHIGFG